MATKVTLDTAAFQGSFTFDEVKLVTRTSEHVVLALSNAQGDRLVVTLPKSALAQLGDWRRFL